MKAPRPGMPCNTALPKLAKVHLAAYVHVCDHIFVRPHDRMYTLNRVKPQDVSSSPLQLMDGTAAAMHCLACHPGSDGT